MPYKDKRFDAFRRQRMESRKRGIAFHFTFEDWVAWWEEHLGLEWLTKRGSKRHQFVMARKGDMGDYHRSNVECITASQNATDNNYNNPDGHNHGNGGACRGRKQPLELKVKLSRMRMGADNPFYGKKHSEVSRQKMRDSSKHFKKAVSIAARKRMSKAQQLRWLKECRPS
jgi:hypothetical protein